MQEQVRLGQHLARRLLPPAVAVGLLVSVGFPAAYCAFDLAALRRDATAHARSLSRQLQGLIVENPALWKYQAGKYTDLIEHFLLPEDVIGVRVLDGDGRSVATYERETGNAHAWWHGHTPVGSAPIRFNNRVFGDVQVAVSLAGHVHSILLLSLFSVVVGTGLAVLIYVFPARVVTATQRERDLLRATANRCEQRFLDLVQTLDAIVWEADAATSEFTFVSQAAETILGYPAERWLKEPGFLAEHIHADDRVEILERRGKATAEGRDHQLEWRAVAADGRTVWVRDIVHVIRGADGRPRYLRGVMVDINERKRLEAELLQAQKMEALGRLAGGVAHDFNNLLTVIMGRNELVRCRLEPGNPLRGHIDLVDQSAKRAANLTGQLLAFSRKQMIQPRVLDLNATLAGMEPMLRRLIGEDIELVVVPGPALGLVKADPAQIDQIVMNLAVNARDAMLRGGRLTIETSNVRLDDASARIHPEAQAGPYVMLAVSDTGCGMSKEVQARIFDPFFTTKGPGKGTGLGLATVHGTVKQSHGHIYVYSEPGKGATFKVYLPQVEDVADALTPDVAPTEVPGGSETILLVEDEDDLRDLAREILQTAGYTVLDARDGVEGLTVAEQHEGPIHLLVTDMVMPQMSGRELAERLARRRREMKVLYVSGYTDDAIVRGGVLDPDTPFLQKPFTSHALATRVRQAVDSPRQLDPVSA